jgi:hypothetical protein
MAIAFDAFSEKNDNNVSSSTLSHTTGSGSNRIMWVGVWDQNNDTITGVTYNGVPLTQAVKVRRGTTGGSEYVYLYYLINPAVGTNNVVVSRSVSSNDLQFRVATYTGAAQTGQPTSTASANPDSASFAYATLTITQNNSWAVAFCMHGGNNDVNSSDPNFTRKGTLPRERYFDSNKTIAVGSYTGTFNNGGEPGQKWGLVMASFAPAAEVASIDSIMFGHFA